MVTLRNLTRFKIKESFLKKIAKLVLEKERSNKKILSVVFLDEQEMARINGEYRKKSGATDVLSFEGDGEEIGEIAICPKKVFENAKKFNIDEQEELLRVLIHGILHLLGYSHEDSKKEAVIMEEKQELYLKTLS